MNHDEELLTIMKNVYSALWYAQGKLAQLEPSEKRDRYASAVALLKDHVVAEVDFEGFRGTVQ
jgi:hypothetical protein